MSSDERHQVNSEAVLHATLPSIHGTLDRRAFLVQATAVTSGLIVSNAIAAIASPPDPKQILKIASFLTGKSDLSDDLVGRAFAALLAEHPGFGKRLMRLIERINAAAVSDVESASASDMNGHGRPQMFWQQQLFAPVSHRGDVLRRYDCGRG